MSITLPPPLYEEAQSIASAENRTMSELFREALRVYQRERFWQDQRLQMTTAAALRRIQSEDDVVDLVRSVRRETANEASAKDDMRPTGTE